MSLAPIITISRSVVAARSLRYPEMEKKDSEHPRVLYRDAVNCRPETAIEEFAELRQKHGHYGRNAFRKVPANYTLPESGEDATHLRKIYPGGKKYWAEPKDGETATHIRREGVAYEPAGRAVATHRRAGRRWIEDSANPTHVAVEGGYVRGTEAINLIYSFDLSSVNPNDAGDTERAFQYVRAEIEDKFRASDGTCAVQAKLIAQADAKGMVDEHGTKLTDGGKFHVHAVLNAVQMKDMQIDGEIFKAGRKLSAKATDIDWVRDKQDDFARAHPQYGFTPQPKGRDERKADKRSAMDRRMAAQCGTSNHDLIREAFDASMDDARVTDLNTFIGVMRDDHGVTVNHRGKKKPTLSYRLPEMSQPVRGHRLGEHYTHESTLSQLEAKAAGLPRRKRPQKRQQLPPKPDPVPSQEEIEEARDVVAELAREESLDQWIEDWAEEEKTTVASLLQDRYLTEPEDRTRLHRMKANWEAKVQAHHEAEAERKASEREEAEVTEPAKPHETLKPTKLHEAPPAVEDASKVRPEPAVETTAEPESPQPAETEVQRLLRGTIEDEEPRAEEHQPATQSAPPPKTARPRTPPPGMGLSFADLRKQNEERAPTVGGKKVAELDESNEPPQEPAVVSEETPEAMEDARKRGPDAAQDADQVDERPKKESTSARKSPRQRAQEQLQRRLAEEGLDGPEKQNEDQLG